VSGGFLIKSYQESTVIRPLIDGASFTPSKTLDQSLPCCNTDFHEAYNISHPLIEETPGSPAQKFFAQHRVAIMLILMPAG